MENRKDIGKAFNEKLSALNQTPNDKVWQNIHAELEKKKKRRIGFFFFWTTTIGFILLGLFGTYYMHNQNPKFRDLQKTNSTETTIGNTNINDKKDNKNNYSTQGNNNNLKDDNSIENDNLDNSENSNRSENAVMNIKSNKNAEASNKNNPTVTISNKKVRLKTNLKSAKNSNSLTKKSSLISKGKMKNWSKKSNKKSKSQKEKSAKKETTISNQNLDALKGTESSLDANSLKKAADKANKQTDTTAVKKPKDKTKNINMFPKDSTQIDSALTYKKFYVEAFASPTYYNYFSKNSTLDNRLNSNAKTSEIIWSYGISLGYDFGENFSIQIGYGKTNLSFTTNNALVNTSNYSSINYNPNVSNQSIYAASNNAEKMNITQKISYTEIPLELKYKLYDKKIRLRAIAGFSYLFLSDNSVAIKTSNGFNQEIGKTYDLSETSFSANIGAGIDCRIFKNVDLFAEPMFNYQVKAFSNNYKPYYFGIHTGIRYSFNN